MAVAPTSLTIRAYGVGFGDCFLLTFHYANTMGDRHMLIDFGSTQSPPNARPGLLKAVADDIAKVVGPQLHVLVATHRHADHIRGFATSAGQGPGSRIAKLKPALVIQPWTEQPDAPRHWEGPGGQAVGDGALTGALALMGRVAAVVKEEASSLPRGLRDEIRFVAADALSNQSAVRNLARMGANGKALYVSAGTRVPTAALLPGVKITVLGPPTLRQKLSLTKQAAQNREEYWHFHSFWQLQAQTAHQRSTGTALFPDAATLSAAEVPPEARWFLGRIKKVRGDQLLRIVRAMDDALNNTSVILLIQAGNRRFLFPGDAQWESWEYALKRYPDVLRNVDLYKVGHHGSLNATPRTLWKSFARRSTGSADPRRLHTLLSTRSDSKHGHRDRKTEVPRETLLEELRKWSVLRSTQELESTRELALKLHFDVRR